MRRCIEIIVVAVVSLVTGAWLHRCQSEQSGYKVLPCPVVTDTVKYVDTIPYHQPPPSREEVVGTVTDRLAVAEAVVPEVMDESGPTVVDSADVIIPIVQREYEGVEYHAWVSGYDPKLDSIYVFPRHEVVTIREPGVKPKRWGVGVFAGYGMTRHGLQPCAGVSITYNLWQF